MTIEGCKAALRHWGMTYFRTTPTGATLWMDRFGNVQRITDLTVLSNEERRDYLKQIAERNGEEMLIEESDQAQARAGA